MWKEQCWAIIAFKASTFSSEHCEMFLKKFHRISIQPRGADRRVLLLEASRPELIQTKLDWWTVTGRETSRSKSHWPGLLSVIATALQSLSAAGKLSTVRADDFASLDILFQFKIKPSEPPRGSVPGVRLTFCPAIKINFVTAFAGHPGSVSGFGVCQKDVW